MQISKIITTVVATACISTAAPTNNNDDHHDRPNKVGDGNAVCGNGQVVSCCNSQKGDTGADILGGLLGGNCDALQIPIVNLIPAQIQKACGNNQAACCTGDQNGLVNLACTNLNVL
ncbi:hypothetical protein V495_00951 [Pseudogymnoascus sp. VKM F-4514 (FW-929)]|nr:hypothetical protein V495_00951 [Pseudogymnoascus sp. VKM F-4514 (FW-929)]KFY64921.1 hypothetical protein V497_01565 [Pseudogymnoascus sp. VKM F-4516 (FW-969)]